jgi:Lon protease-like protein
VLPLRVFETRYVDMVRACMKQDAPFGVVAIRSGKEVGDAAEPYSVGTLAHITEWDMPEFGVLLLSTLGGERFRIIERRTLPSQLVEARIERLPTDVDIEAGESLELCANVLSVVIGDLLEQARDETGEGFINPFPEPHRLDDAGWVANRWSEMLPISLDAKQSLLELDDVATRLQKVEQHLRDNGVI